MTSYLGQDPADDEREIDGPALRAMLFFCVVATWAAISVAAVWALVARALSRFRARRP